MAHFLPTFLTIFRVPYFTQFHIEILEFVVQKKSQINAKNGVEKYAKNATFLVTSLLTKNDTFFVDFFDDFSGHLFYTVSY